MCDFNRLKALVATLITQCCLVQPSEISVPRNEVCLGLSDQNFGATLGVYTHSRMD